MSRNIVICADGTGNTFDDRMTNVTRLVESLSLQDHRRQVAVYAQGVGTNGADRRRLSRYQRNLNDPAALRIAYPPVASWLPPKTWFDRGRGLLFGHGLRAAVRELYRQLTQLYEGPDDSVFLIGFSRGAFAVRALAGLLYRCHLPPYLDSDFDERFDRAWQLFKPIPEDRSAIAAFRADQRPCRVHFLGVWDTVKSYGGLTPVMLPHLRHNPVVSHVRHALALNERRAWFKATTWGQLDLDRDSAMTRLHADDRLAYEQQDIAEVWFTGCHSDIGGGYRERITAEIALRWMLGEAVHIRPGLELNTDGWNLLAEPDLPPEIHESYHAGWRLVERIPRREIDNGGLWPVSRRRSESDGDRNPAAVPRAKQIWVHATVDRNNLRSSGGVQVVTAVTYRQTGRATN